MKRIALITIWLAAASISLAAEPPAKRPPSWAQTIQVEGVPNLHKMNDGLYRSAQPTAEGMKNLKRKEAALREMTGGGFGFHAVWQNLPAWIEQLDIEAIKREAGIKTDPANR
jgi:hypothetical protein